MSRALAQPVIGGVQPSDAGPWEHHWDDVDAVAHAIPPFGPRHWYAPICWCHPVKDEEENLVIHNVAQ